MNVHLLKKALERNCDELLNLGEAKLLGMENGRANGALRKLGAVQEGVLRRAFRKEDRVMDATLWTILADEWRQTRVVWNRALVH